MRALQYTTIGSPPEVQEIERPRPGPGEVLLKIAAAGICHSDSFVMSLPEDQFTYDLPLTLGHEGAGWIEELGDGVAGFEIGELVAVYGPWGCGTCRPCSQGEENYCLYAERDGIHPPGLGAPGAIAEYMIVDDPRHLIRIGGLDPVEVVSLTDAGLTPYHAIKAEMADLFPGSVAVVIGAGGLGHVGIQILRAVTGTTVVALDVSQDKLDLAEQVGAHHTMLSDEHAAQRIRELTDGVGADVVFDFVGAPPTVETARAAVRKNGAISIIGIGGGLLPTGFFSVPYGARVRTPYWGTRAELIEVFDMARSGQVTVHTERYSLDDAPSAYDSMHAGTLRGRAVVVPHN